MCYSSRLEKYLLFHPLKESPSTPVLHLQLVGGCQSEGSLLSGGGAALSDQAVFREPWGAGAGVGVCPQHGRTKALTRWRRAGRLLCPREALGPGWLRVTPGSAWLSASSAGCELHRVKGSTSCVLGPLLTAH